MPVRANVRPTSSNPYAKKNNQNQDGLLSEMHNKKEMEELKEKN